MLFWNERSPRGKPAKPSENTEWTPPTPEGWVYERKGEPNQAQNDQKMIAQNKNLRCRSPFSNAITAASCSTVRWTTTMISFTTTCQVRHQGREIPSSFEEGDLSPFYISIFLPCFHGFPTVFSWFWWGKRVSELILTENSLRRGKFPKATCPKVQF